MKIALIADVHSDFPALCEVLKDAERRGAQELIFCGDYICDGPDTSRVIDLIRDCGSYIIAGNREQYMLDHREGKSDWDAPQYLSLKWIYDRLTPRELDWMASLPQNLRVTLDGKRLNISHGSPYRQRDNLRPVGSEPEYERMAADFDDDVFVFAHTHRQFHLRHGGRLFINPGSAGMPTDSHGYKYSILDTEGDCAVTERAISYDIITIRQYYDTYNFADETGFWAQLFIASLRDNTDWMPRFVGFMHSYAAELGVADTTDIPAEIFERCVSEYKARNFRSQEQI